jgi:8-oxo-dGTP pyrophosphatase MutT (NUDIX family)
VTRPGLQPPALRERLRLLAARSLPLEGRRHAAVAAVLAPDEADRLCFVLTRRSAALGRHRGQWALPGGRLDDGETPETAARRELAEELGVELDPGAVLGRLDDYATRSGFVITPVVLWSSHRLELRPDPREVAAAYEVPLSGLDRPDVPRLQRIEESERPVLSVPVGDGWVHAPTAAIVYQLFELAHRGRVVRVAEYEQPVFAWR